MHIKYVFLVSALALLSGCVNNGQSETTPWGTPLQGNQVAKGQTMDSVEASTYKLADIQNNGELIMLTLTGPDTYYDHRGYKMGLQYRLCEKFAQKIGVSLRVDVCKDEAEMVERYVIGYMAFWHIAFVDESRLVPCNDDALRNDARRKIDRYIADHPPVETFPRFYLVLLRQPIAPMEADGMSRVYQM